MSVRNRPSDEGRAMGEQLARFAEVAERRWAGEGAGFVPVRCKTCAFRAGSIPNGCTSTVMDATKCMLERIPFLCHERDGLCGGYLLLVGGEPSPATPIEAPWPFSEPVS
jgi:hypothetical protein